MRTSGRYEAQPEVLFISLFAGAFNCSYQLNSNAR